MASTHGATDHTEGTPTIALVGGGPAALVAAIALARRGTFTGWRFVHSVLLVRSKEIVNPIRPGGFAQLGRKHTRRLRHRMTPADFFVSAVPVCSN
jgi:NADPH-dependent 2,4-dienoyl-CoA reductase/sulfur reductase-like enzyme